MSTDIWSDNPEALEYHVEEDGETSQIMYGCSHCIHTGAACPQGLLHTLMQTGKEARTGMHTSWHLNK